MIPAPVTRSATTVPGSGIAVGFTEVAAGYMFPKSPVGAVSTGSVTGSTGTGSAMTGDGDATTGSTGTGSAMTGDGDATTGSTGTGSAMTGDGDAATGSTGIGAAVTGRGGWDVDGGVLLQAGEKFPGPHTYCAEAGGAAAR